jgi:signal transduction histidine kinase/ActR/RegA family two-component response regulator
MSGLIAAIITPAALMVAALPGPYALFDRMLVVFIAAMTIFIALLSHDARRARGLARVLGGTLIVLCLVLAARIGMGPGVALGLGSGLILVAIFFGARAVWWVGAGTTLAIVALGAANRAGLLHPTDPAKAFDWSKMSVWVRVAASYVAAMSVAASAVAKVIAHLEESLRERDRLLVAERQAILENTRLLEAEHRARERLSRLQEVTASLARASTPEDVIDAACRISSEAVHGQTAALWKLEGDGTLRLAGFWGTPPGYLNQFSVIPPGANLPAQQVVRTGQPMWIETEDDYRAASAEMHAIARGAGRILSFCVLPLAIDGIVKGVITFAQPTGHRFDDDERAYYATLGLHCSHALERATLHKAARESAARAEEANRLKDDFLSTVTHELRTPLNAISGWAYMLRSGGVPVGRQDHALEVIERNAGAQAKLIADLLDVSRIGAGRLRLNLAPAEPAQIVQLAVDAVKPSADARGIRIAVTVSDNEPIRADVGRIQQVLCNLLANAVKFSTDRDQVEIAVRHEAPNVIITVRDHGEGIKPEFMPYLFEPFRQADAGATRSHGGLGLGLTITKRLVELHGGTIQAHSEGEGRGATFVVRLPGASACAAATPDARTPLGDSNRSAGRELGGLNVLLVEDESDTRELLLTLFEFCGANASGACSAADALEQFHRDRPDIIVSDVGLPGEDGLTFLRKLRQLPGGDIPAVALTAFVRPQDRDVALAAGFDAHVAKPIEPTEFLHVLTQVLRDRRGHELTPV